MGATQIQASRCLVESLAALLSRLEKLQAPKSTAHLYISSCRRAGWFPLVAAANDLAVTMSWD